MQSKLTQAEADQLMATFPEPAGTSPSSLDNRRSIINTYIPPISATRPSLHIAEHRCHSAFCIHCADHVRHRMRSKWLPSLSTFKHIFFVTFTISDGLFGSPKEAMEYLRAKGCVNRAINKLHEHAKRNRQDQKWFYSNRYVWALEFQNNGMPHYHLVLDARFIPHEVLEHIWCNQLPDPQPGRYPKPGQIWFSQQFEGQSVCVAASEVINYMTKAPASGFPTWVLEYGGRNGQLRRFGGNLGRPGRNRKQTNSLVQQQPKKRQELKTSKAPGRTHAERVAGCGQTTTVTCVMPFDPASGEVKETRVFIAELAATKEELVDNGLINWSGHLQGPLADFDAKIKEVSKALDRPELLLRRSRWRL